MRPHLVVENKFDVQGLSEHALEELYTIVNIQKTCRFNVSLFQNRTVGAESAAEPTKSTTCVYYIHKLGSLALVRNKQPTNEVALKNGYKILQAAESCKRRGGRDQFRNRSVVIR